jgi:hypothetical protein
MRIIFRCWKDRVPYDEAKYLESLKRSKSPLLDYMIPASGLHGSLIGTSISQDATMPPPVAKKFSTTVDLFSANP